MGDTVKVTVKYSYNWLRYIGVQVFGLSGATATTIGSSAAMRLEAIPTHYSTTANTGGTCPASA